MYKEYNLVIWDYDHKPDNNLDDVINWNSYDISEQNRVFSLPNFVEDNAENLKLKYLKLIYDFGETRINGKRIIDHLKVRNNFSFWWMTLFVEKSHYKSFQIVNIIKLMALEQWLLKNNYKKLSLHTSNKELGHSLSILANRLNINFEWKKEQSAKQSTKLNTNLLKRIYFFFPCLIQAHIWLFYYAISNWKLKGIGLHEWRKTSATTTFVSYFTNLEPEAVQKGVYQSRYWTSLIDFLDNKKYPTNWLHIYLKSDLLPSSKSAKTLIQKFNSSNDGNQIHTTLSSFLSVSLILNTLNDWYKLIKLNRLISKQLEAQSAYLWPLFKKDYQSSIFGISAIKNLLFFNLFEKAMNELPTQSKGCYLQENQSWEFGFVSAWKSSGHKNNLIGFPHSTVRFWDLRYFFDSKIYDRKDLLGLPLPNYVGVNGEAAKELYLAGDYPKESLIELDALRYLYLADLNYLKVKENKINLKRKTVLVFGDYLQENTLKQLKLLLSASSEIDGSTYFIIKPHMACPIDIKELKGINCELSLKPIDELLTISDVVYSSAVTSAAVDAYCAGLPVVTFIDGQTMNMSPLRGHKGVYFVSQSKELSMAINCAKVTNKKLASDYFYLENNLPRWTNWLFNNTGNVN